MTPEQFCYWLNGFGELTTDAPTPEQWKAIKEHLETVFTKETPSAPGYLGQDPAREGQDVAASPGSKFGAGDLDGAISALDAGLEQSRKDRQEQRERERNVEAYTRYWRELARDVNARHLKGRSCDPYVSPVYPRWYDWPFAGPSLTC